MRVNCVALLSGKVSRVVLIAAFCIGASASAFAFTPTQAQREACTPDAFRLCGSEIPDIGRVTACMIAKKASLSPACRAVFAAAAGEKATHRSHEREIRTAYEHRHHLHWTHAQARHHSKHWHRYAYNRTTHAHHRWAGR